MHIDVLNCAQRKILPGLATAFESTELYLAGGTALALQVGHRPSVDFDWFAGSIGEPENLYRRFQYAGFEYVILSESRETIYVEIEGVQGVSSATGIHFSLRAVNGQKTTFAWQALMTSPV